MEMWRIERLSINPTSPDASEQQRILRVWETHCASRHNVTSRLQQLLQMADDNSLIRLGLCTEFADFSCFLPELGKGDEWTVLCNNVLSDIASLSPAGVVVSPSLGNSVAEPVVVCLHS